MKNEIKMTLTNGKMFNGGEGIDITVFPGLNNIPRFCGYNIPGKFSVSNHLFLCCTLVQHYCEWMTKNFQEGKFSETYNNISFRYELFQEVLSHDFEEVMLNDIPLPVHIEGLEIVKDEVREAFKSFLKLKISKANAITLGLDHIDKAAAFIEIEYYLMTVNVKNLENIHKYYGKKLFEYGLSDWMISLGVGSKMFNDFKLAKESLDANQVNENKFEESKPKKKKRKVKQSPTV